jgi:hypothetical protein
VQVVLEPPTRPPNVDDDDLRAFLAELRSEHES